MSFIFWVLAEALSIYTLIVVLHVASSWLIALNVIDPRNPKVRQVLDLLSRAVDPVLVPIRKVLPVFGGLDLSPVVLLFGIMFVQRILYSL